jgi:hypothetical protein
VRAFDERWVALRTVSPRLRWEVVWWMIGEVRFQLGTRRRCTIVRLPSATHCVKKVQWLLRRPRKSQNSQVRAEPSGQLVFAV